MFSVFVNLGKLYKLKKFIRGHINFLSKLRVISKKKIYSALFLATITLLFEGLGVSILVPLISFIQVEGDIEKFKDSTKLSMYIFNLFNFLGIKISLFFLSFVAVLLIFLRQLLNYFNVVLQQKIFTEIHKKVNLEMFNSLMKSSQTFMTGFNSGKFINATDIEPLNIAMAVKSYFTSYTNILTMVIYTTILLLTSFIPTIIGVVFLILVIFLTGSKFAIKTKRISENLVNLRSEYRDLTTERFLGWKTIKTFDTVNYETFKLLNIQNKLQKSSVSISKLSGIAQLIFVTASTVLVIVVLNILVGNFQFDTTKLVIFGIAFMRLTPIFKAFQHNINRLVELLPSYIFCENIYEKAKQLSIKDNGYISNFVLKKEIKFEDICYRYNKDQKNILENLNFSIKIGHINAITGPSGSGKSTIVSLLSKILVADKGQIYFDSNEINNFKEKYLRKLITYIPQDPFLFNDSIINNITYGSKRISKNRIWNALAIVKMDKFIKSLPRQLSTNVGLLGQSLSGGQRQRLILARAIIKNSEILILDEATSAIDTKTDDIIQKSLKAIKKKKKKITIILISHRLSSFMNTDHLVAIRNGKIEYEGKPNNLRRDLI